MRVVIVGCGRVGAELAKALAEQGQDVVVIDPDSDAFERLGEEFPGEVICGSGTDLDILEQARIKEAQAFAAVTDRNQTNIAAALIAQKHFGIPKVLVRISDPARIPLYESVGLKVICPTAAAASEAKRAILEQT